MGAFSATDIADAKLLVLQDGTKVWMNDEMLHREDGPARIYGDGREEFWYKNTQVSRDEFVARTPYFEAFRGDIGVYISPSFDRSYRIMAPNYGALKQAIRDHPRLWHFMPGDDSVLPMVKKSNFSVLLNGSFNNNAATCMFDFFVEDTEERSPLHALYFYHWLGRYWRQKHIDLYGEYERVDKIFAGKTDKQIMRSAAMSSF